MNRFKIQHAYRCVRDGQQFGPWQPGEEIELGDDDAQWLERDSPGLLKPAKEERAKASAADRQHRGARTR